MTFRGLARIAACALLTLLFNCPGVQAQFRNAIEGTVADQSGKMVAEAEVVLINIETGVSQTAKTGTEGSYRFPTLPPGHYKITASHTGFRSAVQENITLAGSQVLTIPISLEVGEVTENVTVTSEPVPVQLSEGKVATSITAYEVRNLPLAGRNILDVVTLTPGVTGVGNISSNAGGNDIFSLVGNPSFNASGQRGDGNGFYVDSTSATSNPDPGTFNIIPNPDSVQEVNIATNDYSAEYGRSGSLVIQAVTKSGSNSFHGSLFLYHRDNRLTSRNVFQNQIDPLTGRVIPKSHRNEFGGSIGGPIQKNKMFFFFSWDQLRSANTITRRITIETPEFVNFLKTNRPNNLSTNLLSNFPVDHVGVLEAGSIQTVADVMAQSALGTCTGVGPLGMPCSLPIRGSAIQNFAPTRNGLQWNMRIDRYFNESKDRLYFNYYQRTAHEQGGQLRPGFRNGFGANPRAHYAGISWTHTFSATAVNEAAVGFTRVQGDQKCSHCEIPPISAPGLSEGFGNGFSPALFLQNDFHWRDVLAINRGNHSLKVGADVFTDQENDLFSGPQQRPSYDFLNLFDFAGDTPLLQAGINYDLRNGGPTFQDVQYVTKTYGFFVQDNWKVRSDLSVNLGLRWDFSSNPRETHGRLSNIVFNSGSTFQERIANASVGIVPEVFNVHRIGYFAPRLSFAWAPDRYKSRLSIRGGMGVFMSRWPNILWSDQVRFNPPFQAGVTADTRTPAGPQPVYGLCQLDVTPFNCPVPAGLVVGVNERGGPIGARAGIGGTAPDLRYSYTVNRFLGVQYAFSSNWILEADYLGSHGVHLYIATNRNRFAGDRGDNGVIDRLNPFFAGMSYTDNSGWSNSNSGTVSLRKRFSHGYTFQTTYTFGKTVSITDATGPGRDSGLSPIVDANNFNAQSGLASFDIPKRFAFSLVYEIPKLKSSNRFVGALLGGWQIGAIGILQDGYPAWISSGLDLNGDGAGPDPPDTPAFGNSRNCGRSDFLDTRCFSPADFPIPACVRTDAGGGCIAWSRGGNLGRNTFRGPGLANVDTSLMRNFGIPWFGGKEGARLQLRGEVYNLFNRVNLADVVTNIQDGNFGRSTFAFNPRTIQLGVRVEF